MTSSDLTQRAEAITARLNDMEQGLLVATATASDTYMAEVVHGAMKVIEQLLSENRQRFQAGFRAGQDEMRQDLDRVSAEREAYRELLRQVGYEGWFHGMERLAAEARRILAENDR